MFELSGHSPYFFTFGVAYVDGVGKGQLVTRMSCRKSGKRYRDTWVGRRWGLSPDRPCEGDEST